MVRPLDKSVYSLSASSRYSDKDVKSEVPSLLFHSGLYKSALKYSVEMFPKIRVVHPSSIANFIGIYARKISVIIESLPRFVDYTSEPISARDFIKNVLACCCRNVVSCTLPPILKKVYLIIILRVFVKDTMMIC